MTAPPSSVPPLLPLATSTWDEAEHAALQRVIQSGQFTMGAEVAAFERAFAATVGSRHAVMVNSGSSANLLMVAALCFRKDGALARGDEVIVPAISWPTTYYPLAQYGLHVKFVDVDPDTLNYDLKALAAAISPRTRLLMAVNLLGNANDFTAIRALMKGRKIELIEDNCESLGATFDGRSLGTHGVMGTFSCFFSHHISTMEGGVVVTDDDELFHILLCLRAHGWTRNLPKQNLVTGTKSDDAFAESFRFVLPGYNVRPLELSGAVGQAQLAKLPTFLATRRRNAAHFQSLFADHPWLTIQKEIGQSSWFGFSLVLRKGAPLDRAALVQRLHRLGVDCRPIVAGNFAKNPVLRWFDHDIHASLDHADWVDRNGLFIGNHHFDVTDALTRIRRELAG